MFTLHDGQPPVLRPLRITGLRFRCGCAGHRAVAARVWILRQYACTRPKGCNIDSSGRELLVMLQHIGLRDLVAKVYSAIGNPLIVLSE